MPDVGFGATTSAITLHNTAGLIATIWQKAADASRDFQGQVLALGHAGLVRKGVDDTGHSDVAGHETDCAPGLLLYLASVMNTAADVWDGEVVQSPPFSFSNATGPLRAPRPGG